MKRGKDNITLGSGDLYALLFDKETGIPELADIEKPENMLGFISGGANLEYKSEFYTSADDSNRVTKTILTKEEVVLKSGILTWNGNTLKKLVSTARVSEDKITGIRTIKVGGIDNAIMDSYVVHFHYKDKKDGDLRVTIVGNNQAGFSLAFAKDKETVIDTEFKAQPFDDEGTLIILREEIEKESEAV